MRYKIGKPVKTTKLSKVLSSLKRDKLSIKTVAFVGVVLIMFGLLPNLMQAYKLRPANYQLSAGAQNILGREVDLYAKKLAFNNKDFTYEYNKGYQPGTEKTADGLIAGPRFTASFEQNNNMSYTLNDTVNEVPLKITPKYGVAPAQQDSNRLIYPIRGLDAQKVITVKASIIKEDIILNKFEKDKLEFTYELGLTPGTVARLESDGSVGIYGVNGALLGNVTAATEADQALLDKARQNSQKTKLLFRIPAPFIVEQNKKLSQATAHYRLDGNKLTIVAEKLNEANYPLSIDPSVYIETAAKLMRGNNETNTDFDVTNELIQKSQTTGARIDEWTDTLNLPSGYWDNGFAASAGYVYSVGGRSYTIASTVKSTTGSSTFQVPAGVTSITVEMWGGGGGGGGGGSTGGGGNGGGGGYATTTLSVTPLETLNTYVGAGGGAGTGRSDSGDGGGGGGHSEVDRSGTRLIIAPGGGGGGGGDNNVATPGGYGAPGGNTLGSSGDASGSALGGGGGTQAAGGAAGTGGGNTGTAGGLESAGDGADGRSGAGADGGANNGGAADDGDGGTGSVTNNYAGGGGGGGGYYGGGGGSGSVNGDAGGGGGGSGSCYTSGFNGLCLAGSGTTPGNSSDSDRSGIADGGGGGGTTANGTAGEAGRIVIYYATASATSTAVRWAHLNSSTNAVEVANPGTGACASWCTSSSYDLSETRLGSAVVAYNGFLYVMGGSDGTNRESTVWIAKLGANGEPQLWHPTNTDKSTWNYWYTDTGLNGSTARSYFSAVAYNNRMYVLGGQTNASSGGVTTVEMADILPNGRLGTWTTTGMQALPSARHGHNVHVYNDVMYLIGGNSSGTLQNSVYYSKLNSDGTMNSWTATNSFTTARSSFGGNFTTIWGAYIYLSGGCSALTSGYCSTVTSDTQIASLNADGTISPWGSISNLSNNVMGYNLASWQDGLYKIGGCVAQDTSTGSCYFATDDVSYGTINPAGEVSTVDVSSPSGSGNCTGGSPYSCDLPTVGDDGGEIGHMLNMSVVLNGYLYVIGGCAEYDCNTGTNSPTTDNISSNTAYVSIDSNGRLTAPSSCGGTSYGAWCVDSTNTINGADGVAAAAVSVFNGRIYVLGGLDSSGAVTGDVYYNTPNGTTGAPSAWTAQTLSNVGITENIFYTYIYTRANPGSAGTYPGNLYVFGGCGNGGSGAGCSGSDYETEVYKCNIEPTGELEEANANDCDTAGQLQIDSTPGSGGTDGLGIHSGTVYANYIYLIGGISQAETDKDDVLYAKFDDSNNVVAADGGSAWIESGSHLSIGRRRGWAFGYNGHIYSLGGYDGDNTEILPFIEWAKIDVSDGSIDSFITSSITIKQRWGLSVAVSNSYAYVFGGCDVGASPNDCTSFEPAVQTFQLYNNESGALNDYTAQTDDTFADASTEDRWGASSVVYNGYLYVAGGCISATDCTNATNNVQYASINSADGTVNSWNTASNHLPQDRAWGSLEIVQGYLYYLGGQDDAGDEKSDVYYVGSFSGGDINAAWSTASGGIGDTASQAAQDRTRFGSAVWNDRIYVVGGVNDSAAVTNTVYISPTLTTSGGIAADSWASDTDTFDVSRSGMAVTAYANNLYIFGGFDGTNYLSDVQFTQINSDGTVDAWTFTTSLPAGLREAKAVSANGYIYLIGGRSAASTCVPNTLITPISANTTIATGNNPTGVGEWYETNVRYATDRYGSAIAYDKGKIYLMGGGCTAPIDCSTGSVCNYYGTVKSQPQVAIYSRMIDTDTDVFPTDWLMNGLDNSIGARWQLKYRSMHDLDTLVNPNEDCGTSSSMAQMTTWGQETEITGGVTLGTPGAYTPKNSSGGNINCARYFYFYISIDASKTFGYPEDVNRGPTISDISLFFTSDPSKRLRHGKTFTGGELQPLDTPFP